MASKQAVGSAVGAAERLPQVTSFRAFHFSCADGLELPPKSYQKHLSIQMFGDWWSFDLSTTFQISSKGSMRLLAESLLAAEPEGAEAGRSGWQGDGEPS